MPARLPQTADAVTAEPSRLLSRLTVALYDPAPHHCLKRHGLPTRPLTGPQTKAVVLPANRGPATMGGLTAGLEISPAATTELVVRMVEKGFLRRETDPADRRLVRVRLAGPAEAVAGGLCAFALRSAATKGAASAVGEPAVERDAAGAS